MLSKLPPCFRFRFPEVLLLPVCEGGTSRSGSAAQRPHAPAHALHLLRRRRFRVAPSSVARRGPDSRTWGLSSTFGPRGLWPGNCSAAPRGILALRHVLLITARLCCSTAFLWLIIEPRSSAVGIHSHHSLVEMEKVKYFETGSSSRPETRSN